MPYAFVIRQRFCLQFPLLLYVLSQSVTVRAAEGGGDIYDLPLDQLTKTEVQMSERYKQNPSAVDVVTADDFRSFGWRTLGDALNGMRGLYIRNDRSQQTVGVRGFQHEADFNSLVLVMIDGRRMNNNMFDNPFLGEEFMLDVNLIERIEFVHGSSAPSFGSNAVLGVINVITKKGKNIDGVRILGEAGTFNTYRGRLTYGKEFSNGTDLLFNASQYYSEGDDNLHFPELGDNPNGTIAKNADREHSRRLFLKLSHDDVVLRSGYSERFKLNPTAPFDTLLGDPDTNSKDRYAYVDIDYNTKLSNGVALQLRGFYHHYDRVNKYGLLQDEVDPPSRTVELRKATGQWLGGQAMLSGFWDFWGRHHWTAGLDFQYDLMQRFRNTERGEAPFFSDRDGWRGGLSLQDEWRLSDSLMLNVGARLDRHHMINGLRLNPRAGLIWDMTPTVTGKLLYGSTFRAPNAFERDFNDPDFGFLANPNNSEERIKSYEGIVEWRPGNGYKLIGSVFYNGFVRFLDHDVGEDHDAGEEFEPAPFANSEDFNAFGFELEAEKRWDNGRLLKAAWTYANVREHEYEEGGERSWARNSPRHVVKLHYAEPLFDDMLRLGFEEIFVSHRKTVRDTRAAPYHLFNINLSTKPYYGFQTSLGIYNVFDQRFNYASGSEHNQATLEADGRTVRFRVEYGF